jgi:hypothetical protein
LRDQLHIAPDVVGQHHNLKKSIIVFKLGRGDHLKTFALGLSHQILNIGPLVVFGNNLMGFAGKIRTEDSVGVWGFSK